MVKWHQFHFLLFPKVLFSTLGIVILSIFLIAHVGGEETMSKGIANNNLQSYIGTWKTKLPINNMSLVISLKDNRLVGQLEAFTPKAEHVTDAEFTAQEGSDDSLYVKWRTDDSSGNALLHMRKGILEWKEVTPIQDQTNYILPECTLRREVQEHP